MPMWAPASCGNSATSFWRAIVRSKNNLLQAILKCCQTAVVELSCVFELSLHDTTGKERIMVYEFVVTLKNRGRKYIDVFTLLLLTISVLLFFREQYRSDNIKIPYLF